MKKILGNNFNNYIREYQENLGNCYDLINDYHKNKFFKDHRKYITEFKDKRGNLNRDRPFCIFRRNQY